MLSQWNILETITDQEKDALPVEHTGNDNRPGKGCSPSGTYWKQLQTRKRMLSQWNILETITDQEKDALPIEHTGNKMAHIVAFGYTNHKVIVEVMIIKQLKKRSNFCLFINKYISNSK